LAVRTVSRHDHFRLNRTPDLSLWYGVPFGHAGFPPGQIRLFRGASTAITSGRAL
jgi:hypothetical protein